MKLANLRCLQAYHNPLSLSGIGTGNVSKLTQAELTIQNLIKILFVIPITIKLV